jgi:hypothetical protein
LHAGQLRLHTHTHTQINTHTHTVDMQHLLVFHGNDSYAKSHRRVLMSETDIRHKRME